MVETLVKQNISEDRKAIWRDETSGLVSRYIVKLDDNGEDTAYGALPIRAETGFKASVLSWDKIRSEVTRFPWLSYHHYSVESLHQLKSWEAPRRPKSSPIGTPDAVKLTPEGDLLRSG